MQLTRQTSRGDDDSACPLKPDYNTEEASKLLGSHSQLKKASEEASKDASEGYWRKMRCYCFIALVSLSVIALSIEVRMVVASYYCICGCVASCCNTTKLC